MSSPDPAFTYHSYFHPLLARWVARWGSNDDEIARALGVPTTMLADWQAAHPEFAVAIQEGRTYWLELADKSLQKLMKGYDYDETEILINVKGEEQKPTKIKKTTRHIPPNPTAILFLVRNREAWKMLKHIEKNTPGGFPPNLENLWK